MKVEGEPGDFHMMFGKRCFFGYVNAPNGEVWWFANPPRRDEPASQELSAVESEQWMRTLIDLFEDDAGPAVEIFRATTNRLAAWSTYDLPKVPRWHNERMIVIGDAAHATSPSAGQGASMAIEDGAGSGWRRSWLRGPGRPTTRRPDRSPGMIRDLMLPVAFKKMSSSKAQEWMYGYRIDWEDRVTLSISAISCGW